MSPYKLAWLSLSRRKIPTLIALLSISISVASSGILLRLYRLSGSRFQSIAQGGNAVLGAKSGGLEILLGSLNFEGDYPDFIPFNLFVTLRQRSAVAFEDGAVEKNTSVKTVIPLLFWGKFKSYRVVGTDESFIKRPSPDENIALKEGTWPKTGEEIAIGAQVASQENVKIGQTLVVHGWPQSEKMVSLKVTGILNVTQSVWDKGLYTNLDVARDSLHSTLEQAATPWKENVLHFALIYLDTEGFAPLKSLINQRSVAQLINVTEEKRKLESLTSSGKMLGFLLSALIVFLGSLAVATMMLSRFEAMGSQMAVLRALGYSKSEIRNWLLFEGALLGSFACVLGAILDAIFFPLLRWYLGSALPPPEMVSAPLYGSAVVWILVLVATTLSVFLPLSRIYHQDIHTALKA